MGMKPLEPIRIEELVKAVDEISFEFFHFRL